MFIQTDKNIIDQKERHDEMLEDNGFGRTMPELAQYNMMAVFLRWAYNKDLISEAAYIGEPRLRAALDGAGDIRKLLAESPYFHGCITYDHIKDELKPFVTALYKFGGWNTDYLGWANAYARQYFGNEKMNENYFYYTAYLFVPYDDNLYNYFADKFDLEWNNPAPKLLGKSVGKEILDDIVNNIWSKTEIETIRINVTNGDTTLTSSKAGGYPYWPKNKEFISFGEEVCPILVAQINLRDLKHEKFPDHGLLQFYVSPYDDLGMDEKHYKVVYHETIDETVTEEDVKKRGILAGSDVHEEYCMFPVGGCYPMTFNRTTESINYRTGEVSDIVEDILKNKYNVVLGDKNCWDYLSDADEEFISSKLPKGDSHLLGYAAFTQSDPRSYDEELERYDTVLFQLDSEFHDGIKISIGDSGIMNFFINHEDLENKNFEDVLFNWDCY